MDERETENTPFMCIEVNSFNKINQLAKRFDELFPERIIRLIIGEKYSPFYYLSKGLWVIKKMSKEFDFSCQLENEFTAEDFINEEYNAIFDYFNLNMVQFSAATHLEFTNIKFEGVFLTNGEIHIFDQYIIENVQEIIELFVNNFEGEVLIDITNDAETGIAIIQTKYNIFWLNESQKHVN
jgi:hypothetical protein